MKKALFLILFSPILSNAALSTEEKSKEYEKPAEDEVVLKVQPNQKVIVIENGLVHSLLTKNEDSENTEEGELDQVLQASDENGDGVYLFNPKKPEIKPEKVFGISEQPKSDVQNDRFTISVRPKVEINEKSMMVQNLETNKSDKTIRVGFEFKVRFNP